MNCWPSAVVSWAARMRATWSVEPPGGKPTMNFTVFEGQACAWAKGADRAARATAIPAARRSGDAHGLPFLEVNPKQYQKASRMTCSPSSTSPVGSKPKRR